MRMIDVRHMDESVRLPVCGCSASGAGERYRCGRARLLWVVALLVLGARGRRSLPLLPWHGQAFRAGWARIAAHRQKAPHIKTSHHPPPVSPTRRL